MSRIAYVNGRYVPHRGASVHVEDRGYQFADGVYEVCEVHRSEIIDLTAHLDRLDRSLSELRMGWPVPRRTLPIVLREVIRRNGVSEGMVYLQVTRGVAPRDHAFPSAAKSSLVVTAKSVDRRAGAAKWERGANVITIPDTRWDRVDIKTVGLLPNVLARQEAIDRGAQEAWFTDADGNVLEGASVNAWIVREGELITRPAHRGILRGITRATVVRTAEQLGYPFQERPFTVAEAQAADEAFNTAATTVVMPVVSVDGRKVGNGEPGPVTRALREAFHGVAERTAA